MSDLDLLYRFHFSKLAILGAPGANFEAWSNFIVSWPAAFKELVDAFVVFESVADRSNASLSAQTSTCGRFVCMSCSCKPFMTHKALLCHMRTKHQYRIRVKDFIGADAVCPVCKVQFSTRLRAIAHASEKRCRGKSRVTCHDALLSGRYKPIQENVLRKLDDSDRQARREAVRSGRSTPLAQYAAKRSRLRACPDRKNVSGALDPLPKRRRLNGKQSLPVSYLPTLDSKRIRLT